MRAGYEPAADSGQVTTMRRRTLSAITVRRRPGDPCRGWLMAGPLALPVALGRGGIRANKREGDGGTPLRGIPAEAGLVARRPAHSATDLPAGTPHPPRRWLVRGPCRPPLQSSSPRGPRQQGRPADPIRPPLRLHRRDRPQHEAAGRRPWQRGVHPHCPTWICPDRGLHRFECQCLAAPSGAARAAHAHSRRLIFIICRLP